MAIFHLHSTDNYQASILLDFGKEIYGGVKISSAIRNSMKPIKLRVRLGESVTEAMSDIDILDQSFSLRMAVLLLWTVIFNKDHSAVIIESHSH